MNPRRLAILAGLAGSLLVTGAAGAAFLGTHLGLRPDAVNPHLFISQLLVDFSDPGDRLLSLNGLPGNPMFFSTNSSAGFHQEQFFGADKNFAITAGELGAVPAMRNDTYVNIGIKSGQVTSGGVAAGTADDYSPGTPVGVLFGWNNGGKILQTDLVNGGSFVLVDLADPITDQNIAGNSPNGNSIFIAQLVIDTNFPTTDGVPARVDIFIPSIIWQDPEGNIFEVIVPAPGTLLLLVIAGAAGVRRRRRAG